MNTEHSERDLVCVLFPGIVKNEEAALQCLGGAKSVAEANLSSNKKRLGLTFQPENPFINKIYAERKNTAGVLLKVKVKKKKIDNNIKREVIGTSVVGRVNNIFKFEAMADFQYLPVQCDGTSNQAKCMLDDMLPSGLSKLDFLTGEQSFPYITPAIFSRSDGYRVYRYTDKKTPGIEETDDDVVRSNKTRFFAPIPTYFNLVDELPTAPDQSYMLQLKSKVESWPYYTEVLETVAQKFEERPIWSFNAINFATKIKKSVLKQIMPIKAFYIFDGPWRKMWVKYGYDPRKHPAARFYQTLDFRVRSSAGLNTMVTTRNQAIQHRSTDRAAVRIDEVVPEGAVIFRPGIVITQRQVYYQYCDVKLPEVEELVGAKPQPGYLCHPARGWLAPGVPEACRDHIFRYAKQTMLTTHHADLKFEQASSGDEQNSDEDEAMSSVQDPEVNT